MLIDSYLTEDLHYCAIYISANKKWNRIYKDFVSGISDRSMYNFNFYNFLEFDLNSFSEAGSFLGHTDVKAAGRGVLPAVSEFLKRSVPPLLYEAYDYSPELIDFSEYNRITGGIFSRERRFFYCQRFGEIHGVAVAESSSHTINLFNLGDSVRVIVRGDLPDEEKTRIKRSLLKKVACYFASRCRPYFVYYCYDRDCSYAESLGFRKLERSCEFVLKKELIPSFMDFIETRLSIIEYMKANGK
jgi:hypothetical protein